MLEWVCLKLSTDKLRCACVVMGLSPRRATPFILHAWLDGTFHQDHEKVQRMQKSCGLLSLHGGSVLLIFT